MSLSSLFNIFYHHFQRCRKTITETFLFSILYFPTSCFLVFLPILHPLAPFCILSIHMYEWSINMFLGFPLGSFSSFLCVAFNPECVRGCVITPETFVLTFFKSIKECKLFCKETLFCLLQFETWGSLQDM